MKKTIMKSLLLLFVSAGVFTACDNEKEPNANKPVQTYMAGSRETVTSQFSALATDGIVELIEEDARIIAITTSGSDVYTLGVSGEDEAVVWKNGIATALDEASIIYDIQDIAVKGSTVYVIGKRAVGPISTTTLWTNGVATDLSTRSCEAEDIEVVGNDVYIVGYVEQNEDNTQPVYWKNGVETVLTFPARDGDNTQNGYANSIAVDGNDVYFAGAHYSNGMALWKNNIGEWVGSGQAYPNDQGLAVNNGDVYIVGLEINTDLGYASTLFNNGEATFASGNKEYVDVEAIAGSVYVFEISGGGRRAVSEGAGSLSRQQLGRSGLTYFVTKDGEELYSIEDDYNFDCFAVGQK